MKNLYMRRQGGLIFWRVGRLGGSFYVARKRVTAPGQSRHAVWRYERGAYGPQLRRVRSIADLGGMVLGAFYTLCMMVGMGLAFVATLH